MIEVHIYRASNQKATKYSDTNTGHEIVFRNKPNSFLFAQCCKRPRQAKNLYVYVYYNQTLFFCESDKGCNSANAKPWWCTKHQVMHSPKTRYWSCREGKRKVLNEPRD